jgi:uncharacterized protein (DUF1501 family)
MSLLHHTHISLGGGCIRRRDFLRGLSAAGLAGTLSWRDLVSVHAADLRRRGMACVLLWMQGGPSQFETFDPKPGHENGGETKTIKTAVPGIEIAEHYPHVAAAMQDIALVRSMTTKEGNHQRATFLLHTGYVPTNSVKHPTLGAIVSQQLPNPECELPSFVRVGGRFNNAGGGGILGVDYDPFNVDVPDRPPANTTVTSGSDRFVRRLDLLSRIEGDYAASGAAQEVADHQKLYAKASKMVLSSQMKSFDLAREPDKVRDAYGRSQFGNGCLLARRLIEEGVTFVEVSAGNWDTHDNNFERTKDLAGQVDQPFAHLVTDLRERGMLDKTLVVWMGEFGRTPRVNGRGGRDHYPRAFHVALAGGGIRGGQVIGRTDAGGVDVADRPVTVLDLFQTFCKSLGIDPSKENMSSIGRPLKVVDGGAPVNELFG